MAVVMLNKCWHLCHMAPFIFLKKPGLAVFCTLKTNSRFSNENAAVSHQGLEMPVALAGEVTKINCAANVTELTVHIYYRTMKFSKENFSTTLLIQDHARTVHCSVTTLLKILQVWQIEAPHIWRFLSRANLLLSLSLRIYSLCHTLSAPSLQYGMWHYLFFMILAGTQKSKKEMRAAVQEWESKVQISYLFQDPFHLPSHPKFGFFQRRFLLLPFSSRWKLV